MTFQIPLPLLFSFKFAFCLVFRLTLKSLNMNIRLLLKPELDSLMRQCSANADNHGKNARIDQAKTIKFIFYEIFHFQHLKSRLPERERKKGEIKPSLSGSQIKFWFQRILLAVKSCPFLAENAPPKEGESKEDGKNPFFWTACISWLREMSCY